MKKLVSNLIATVAFVVLVSPVLADTGTTWDKQVASASRFKVLSQFGNAAVFDRETGLVWQQSPFFCAVRCEFSEQFTWFEALGHCYDREVGGRKGWRLPTIEELASLVDTSQPSVPKLPAGHPFSDVQSARYWSATTSALNTSRAWVVEFSNGGVGVVEKAENLLAWCVRGGQGIDGVQ